MANQNHSNHEHYPEEIDLVDVAAVVYRRKATLALVVLCSVIIAIGYWFSLGEKIQVSAVYKIGEQSMLSGNTLPLMSATDSSQLLKMVYLPVLLQSTELDLGERPDIEILYSNPEKVSKTFVLELFVEGSSKDEQILVSVFDGSLELLLKNHEEKFDKYIASVSFITEKKKNKLLLMKQDPSIGMSDIPLLEANVLSLEIAASASTNSVIIKRASAELLEPKALAPFIAGGFVVGLFLGCFAIFFLDLYAKAKNRAAETT